MLADDERRAGRHDVGERLGAAAAACRPRGAAGRSDPGRCRGRDVRGACAGDRGGGGVGRDAARRCDQEGRAARALGGAQPRQDLRAAGHGPPAAGRGTWPPGWAPSGRAGSRPAATEEAAFTAEETRDLVAAIGEDPGRRRAHRRRARRRPGRERRPLGSRAAGRRLPAGDAALAPGGVRRRPRRRPVLRAEPRPQRHLHEPEAVREGAAPAAGAHRPSRPCSLRTSPPTGPSTPRLVRALDGGTARLGPPGLRGRGPRRGGARRRADVGPRGRRRRTRGAPARPAAPAVLRCVRHRRATARPTLRGTRQGARTGRQPGGQLSPCS